MGDTEDEECVLPMLFRPLPMFGPKALLLLLLLPLPMPLPMPLNPPLKL